ncbi:MAG TPA: hypothetical protein VLA41_05990 [Burkholderiales bacterium]|nr:hypothetical protein [Burkholderiales bacterium]
MEKTKQAVDWIGAYLEWSGADWTPPRQAALQAAETDFCAAYLDWMDTGAIAGRQRRERLRQTMHGRRASDVMAGTNGFREAVLLAALRAQSDCLYILRQVVGNGGADVATLKLAVQALDHAQRLIDDERQAKRALDKLQGHGERRAGDRAYMQVDAEWPEAIEHVVADVRSLTDTVVAMQLH